MQKHNAASLNTDEIMQYANKIAHGVNFLIIKIMYFFNLLFVSY